MKAWDQEVEELRVWWIPQVPMKAFEVKVKNLEQAKLILNTLADYDIFQYQNKIKGDYCNTGGLQCKIDMGYGLEWVDWYDDNGLEIDNMTMEECIAFDKKTGEQ